MNLRSWRWIVCGLLLAVVVPVAANWLRERRRDRCELDGATIIPTFQVVVEKEDGKSHRFCCIYCAEIWLQRRGIEPRGVYVTDEVTGKLIDATLAYFVRSLVVNVPATGNRIHAFADAADAEQHAKTCHGIVLDESQRPFRLHR